MADAQLFLKTEHIQKIRACSYKWAGTILKRIKDRVGKDQITVWDVAVYFGTDPVDVYVHLWGRRPPEVLVTHWNSKQ